MADIMEIIIENVKKFPVLYDPTHPDHKNNRIKYRTWDAIAEAMQETNVDLIRNKWKNLRDSYGKHLRANKGETGKHIIRYKTWPWTEQMSFLLPYLEMSGLQPSSGSTPQPSSGSTPTKPESYICQPSEPSTPSLRPPSTSPTPDLKPTPQPYSQNYEETGNFSNYTNKTILTDYDETDLIFLGYSKTVKRMSLRRQASVKFEIARVIMEAELEHAQEVSSYDHRSTTVNSLHEIDIDVKPIF